MKNIKCLYCHKEVNKGRRKFCSKVCSGKWHNRNNYYTNKKELNKKHTEYMRFKLKTDKVYAEKFKERSKRYHRNYFLKNRDKVTQLHKSYFLKNKEKILTYQREYRIKNREKTVAYLIKRQYGIDYPFYLKITKECAVCSFGVKGLVDLHHIDGNNKNQNKDNLIGLCCNCHQSIHRLGYILVKEKRRWRLKESQNTIGWRRNGKYMSIVQKNNIPRRN